MLWINLVSEDQVATTSWEQNIMVDIETYGGRFQAFDKEHIVCDFENIH